MQKQKPARTFAFDRNFILLFINKISTVENARSVGSSNDIRMRHLIYLEFIVSATLVDIEHSINISISVCLFYVVAIMNCC